MLLKAHSLSSLWLPVRAGSRTASKRRYKLPKVKGANGLLPTASLQGLSANSNKFEYSNAASLSTRKAVQFGLLTGYSTALLKAKVRVSKC